MTNPSSESTPVAIIGISCLFAESTDLKAFFRLLMRGINAVSDPPDTHRHLCDYFDPDPKKPDHIYCQRAGFLPRVDFDPAEFGIPPSALEATDTSQLLGLLVGKQALEDAGYGERDKPFDRDRTSVILGVTGTQELVIPLGSRLGHPLWRRALTENGIPEHTAEAVIKNIADRYVSWQENSFPGLLGNVVAGRIANRLNLGGTNCVVDAACASSMSAIHMALLELYAGRADMVLSGGVDTINDVFMHMCFSKSQILSASGEIRPFSQHADGTVLGEGVGLIVLKRLSDARRDGDRIYAVIKGIGSASDGKSNSIYAPRADGQAAALRRAYKNAGVAPESIELLEAHGTGTRVGDEVEFKALCDVFGRPAAEKMNCCALGSVKSNIGHTKAAAGTAGLIKAALSIYHKVLPPTLNAIPVDPKLGIENSPFYLNHTLRPWTAGPSMVRRAGVSAFGFGGSNFHAVLEEFDSRKPEPSWDGTVEIAAFSGATRKIVADRLNTWSQAISLESRTRDIGRLAARSRREFDGRDVYRLVMVLPADDSGRARELCERAQRQLKSDNAAEKPSADPIFIGSGAPEGPIAFLFPGQGSQYVGMGRDLICCFPDSLESFQAAERHFRAAYPLSEYIYPRLPGDSAGYERRLRKTDIAQPAIGAVSLAMCEAMKYFGIIPRAACGHSFGELAALHVAGRIDQNALWRLSVARGQLMAQAGDGRNDAGSMLAVQAPLPALTQMVGSLPDIVLANRNSPMQGVLSGSTPAVARAETLCLQKGWKVVRLPVAAAFHSSFVSSAQIPFETLVQQIPWHPGNIAVMSNTSGKAYPVDEIAAKRLLGAQLASPVDFVANIECLYDSGIRTFVEVGPKAVLTHLVTAILEGRPHRALALDHSGGRQFGLIDLGRTLAHLAALGHPVRLDRWEKSTPKADSPRMRIPLSGANYRNSSEKPDIKAPAVIASTEESPPKAAPGPMASDPKTADRTGLHTEHDPMNTNQKTFLAQALAAVQQGLASMQALQSQTTQAHQKYLESQAEANRTLQQMIQSTQQLAVTAMGDRTVVSPAGVPGPASATDYPNDNGIDLEDQTSAAHPPPASKPASDRRPERIEAKGAAPLPHSDEGESIRRCLVQIVSQLTGYPEEMLGLEMDIEADLGIDSIKRVEILSAIEEQMPHLPKVTPDMVGTLKTLGQMCDYLASDSIAQPHTAPASSIESPCLACDQGAAAAPGSSEVQPVLIRIVSQLTGYPEEMLGLEMDIEADLGIDSIKRVEILSTIEEQMPHLPKVTPDMVGTLKTLGQICDYLAGPMNRSDPSSESQADAPTPRNDVSPRKPVRYEVCPFHVPEGPVGDFSPAADHSIGIVSQDPKWGQAIADALKRLKYRAKLLDRQHDWTGGEPLAGLIVCAPIRSWDAFEWAQKGLPRLNEAARNGHALFFTISRLDGAFGLSGRCLDNPEQGALAGLAKTAAMEWPSVRCRALDVAPGWSDEKAAHAVALEIGQHPDDPFAEIGIEPDGRTGLKLVPVEPMPTVPLRLKPDDVVIVTGGARGVTAAAALALADYTPCTVALIGRSPQPEPEAEWLSALHEEGQIKQAILCHEFKNETPAPKTLETVYRKRMANREMLQTLEAFDIRGIRALYYQLDVRGDQVASTLSRIRREAGPIKALIHGAGVLEDRLIIDKTFEQFQAVYDTKVKGLISLLKATSSDPLNYLVLFSSVSARLGNPGQADYAMANEALNKLAAQQAFEKTDCRVISINWGPWDGGMVTDSLKRNFAKHDIQLIPVRLGAAAMVDEMRHPHNRGVEVVVGGPLQPGDDFKPAEISKDACIDPSHETTMVQSIQREIDAARCPVLQAHLLDGRPVVPLALITEWLAHSALHANPGLLLHGIDQLRLLKGIALDQRKKQIRLMAGSPKRNGEVYEVDVEVRDGEHNGEDLVHSRARAILTDRLPDAPTFKENGHFKSTAGLRPVPEIYDTLLFHGKALRGIEKIVRLSSNGITAQLRCAPSPEQWLDDPMRSRWIADPLVLDCAFQMAIIWCHEHQGSVCLPSYAESYRQYRDRFPEDGVTAVLEVIKATNRKMLADITFLDREKTVIARMTGYEAVMDSGLFKAFGVKAA